MPSGYLRQPFTQKLLFMRPNALNNLNGELKHTRAYISRQLEVTLKWFTNDNPQFLLKSLQQLPSVSQLGASRQTQAALTVRVEEHPYSRLELTSLWSCSVGVRYRVPLAHLPTTAQEREIFDNNVFITRYKQQPRVHFHGKAFMNGRLACGYCHSDIQWDTDIPNDCA